MDLVQQDPVGHQLHERSVADLIGEPHGVADEAADGAPQLIGDTFGDGAGGDAAWLSVPDEPVHSSPEIEAELGELGALARSGLPGDHHNLVITDRGQQLVAMLADRQLGRILDRARRCGPPHCDPLLGCPDLAGDRGEHIATATAMVDTLCTVESAPEALPVGDRQVRGARSEVVQGIGHRPSGYRPLRRRAPVAS